MNKTDETPYDLNWQTCNLLWKSNTALLGTSGGLKQFFLSRFRDPIWVPRISNRVPKITENYHQVPEIRENRVPRITEIRSL